MDKEKKTASRKAAEKPKAEKPAPKPGKTAAAKKAAPAAKSAGMKKQYSKTKPVCKVTFVLPEAAAPSASRVSVAGDFNNWSVTQHQLKRQKNGDFTIAIDLEPGRQYQFRYLIDGSRWENDWHADKYVPSQYGDSENSVVVV